MNRRLIIRVLGAILLVEAAAMLPATLVSILYGDGDFSAMAVSVLIVAPIGLCMLLIPETRSGDHLRLKEGFIITALGWLLMSVCGAIPFMLSGQLPRFEEAFFEAVSGFTTTGATCVTRFEGFPRGVMFWRATTHWVGGMGVLVLTLALLPKLTGRTAHLVKAESPGPSLSKLVPQTGKTAKILYQIYILLTLSEFVALMICGLSPYDAAVHTMATAGTGGFSCYGASIAAFNSVWVEMVISVFMFMFGVNFALYYRFLIGERFRAFYKDEEFRWYFTIVIGLILLISLFNLSFYENFLTSLRYGIFQVCSIMSTTGFVTADFNQWPVVSHILIIIAMLIGSCAGSTAGGIKVIRINMIAKMSRRNIMATGQPKKMDVIRIDGKAVEEPILMQVAQFALMYIALVLLGSFLVSLEGKFDAITNLSAALTCVSNVGPGLGAVGPVENFAGYGISSKVVLSFLMLFGRLELLPMFILFTRSAWKKY
ncbi:MAG: TrkH family potassium uptake protein [Clostridiales bacterium]|nr:TrkH family potassium uptake protein [Clostridiales bacterium]